MHSCFQRPSIAGARPAHGHRHASRSDGRGLQEVSELEDVLRRKSVAVASREVSERSSTGGKNALEVSMDSTFKTSVKVGDETTTQDEPSVSHVEALRVTKGPSQEEASEVHGPFDFISPGTCQTSLSCHPCDGVQRKPSSQLHASSSQQHGTCSPTARSTPTPDPTTTSGGILTRPETEPSASSKPSATRSASRQQAHNSPFIYVLGTGTAFTSFSLLDSGRIRM